MPIIKRNWAEMNNRLEDEARGFGGANQDKRLYRPKFAKDGTFEAIIRFLPAPGDELPLIKKFAHRFKDKFGDYNEECLTTIGQPDPICESNTELWRQENETAKDLARKRARNKSGISNILVINDVQVPSNNGKVFLYRYGKVILDKIIEKCFPDEKQKQLGAKAVNIFDYYEGVNFRVSGKKTQKGDTSWTKYDNSRFEDMPTRIESDDFIERLEKQIYSLKEFNDPKNFKSYTELKIKFDQIRGVLPVSATQPVNQPPAQQPIRPVTPPTVQTETVQPPPVVNQPMNQKITSAPPPSVEPVVNAAPPDADMDFEAPNEGQSEEDFWANIKK